MGKETLYRNLDEKVRARNERWEKRVFQECRESRKDIYSRYINRYKARSKGSPHTLSNVLATLLYWDPKIKPEFEDLTQRDIEDAVYSMSYEMSAQSKTTRLRNLRTFLKYLEREDLIKALDIQRPEHNIRPEELLTPVEISRLIDHAINPRDKAVIAFIYESGARRGELLNIKLKHLAQHENGYRIALEGKTGKRRILIINSAMYIHQWVATHPARDNPEAPLFCTLRDGMKVISPGYLERLLRNSAHRAGITKRVNPHSFRHAQATELAKDFTDSQMRTYLGWSGSSSMPSIYVHLRGEDLDQHILQKNGIKIEDRDTRLKPTECPRCHHIIPPESSYCGFCGMPLTTDATDGNTKALDVLLEELKAHPEILLEALNKIGKK